MLLSLVKNDVRNRKEDAQKTREKVKIVDVVTRELFFLFSKAFSSVSDKLSILIGEIYVAINETTLATSTTTGAVSRSKLIFLPLMNKR